MPGHPQCGVSYFFTIVEGQSKVLLREGAAGRFAGRILNVVRLVEDDDIVLDRDFHRCTYPGIDQVVIRAEDDVRLLHQVARRVIRARSQPAPETDDVLDILAVNQSRQFFNRQ